MKFLNAQLPIVVLALVALVSCSPTSDKLLPKPDFSKPAEKQDLGEFVPFSPRVDILFVIDDSGSMSSHQQNLSDNIDQFIAELTTNQFLEYNIGVVKSTYGDCTPLDRGELSGNPRIVTKTTPNMIQSLKANLLVGTNGCGGTELFFDPIQEALSTNKLQGVNSGFLRADALLAVVIITDSDDQQTAAAANTYNYLLKLKNNDPTKLTLYGVVVPPGETRCPRDYPDPIRLLDFLKIGNGLNFNLCDKNFGRDLKKIGEDVVSKVEKVIYLDKLPVVNTIRLTYGKQTIINDLSKGWSYDPRRNAIVLSKDMELLPEPPGTQIQVYFVPADIPEQ